jgi:hypothetical protein
MSLPANRSPHKYGHSFRSSPIIIFLCVDEAFPEVPPVPTYRTHAPHPPTEHSLKAVRPWLSVSPLSAASVPIKIQQLIFARHSFLFLTGRCSLASRIASLVPSSERLSRGRLLRIAVPKPPPSLLPTPYIVSLILITMPLTLPSSRSPYRPDGPVAVPAAHGYTCDTTFCCCCSCCSYCFRSSCLYCCSCLFFFSFNHSQSYR